jgi:hypothetical protein
MSMYHDHVPSSPYTARSASWVLDISPPGPQLRNPLCRSAGCVAYFPGGQIKIHDTYNIQFSAAWSYVYYV